MKRRVELARGAPLVARKGLARTARPRQAAPAPRKTAGSTPRTTGIPKAARDAVRARSGGMCELALPDVCLGPAHNVHHRAPRRMGGSRNPLIHALPNLLHVCGTGNAGAGCHPHLERFREQAVACGWLIPSGGDPATAPALLAGRWIYLTPDGGYADTPPGAPHV